MNKHWMAALGLAGALLALEGGTASPGNDGRPETRSVAPVPVPGNAVTPAFGVARMTPRAILPRGQSLLMAEMVPRGSVLTAPEAVDPHAVTLAPVVPGRRRDPDPVGLGPARRA